MKFLFYNLYSLPNSTTGLDDILVETVTVVPSLTPLLLVFVYFVVLLGGISRQKARMGVADTPMWSVVGSISAFLVALLMAVIEGLINLDWLVITFVVAIFSGVWLFLDRKPSEI